MMTATAVGLQMLVGGSYEAPSLVDINGAIRIALLQHATMLGIVVSGIAAGQMSAADINTSAAFLTLNAEPRRARLIAVKTMALIIILWASVVVMSVALVGFGWYLTGTGTDFQDLTGTSFQTLATTALLATTVFAFQGAVATAITVATGSELAPVVAFAAAFIVGQMFDRSWVVINFTPYYWIGRWMDLHPLGSFSDFVSFAAAAGGQATNGAILIAVTSIVLAFSPHLVNYSLHHNKGQ